MFRFKSNTFKFIINENLTKKLFFKTQQSVNRYLNSTAVLNSKLAFNLIDRSKKPKIVTDPIDAISCIQSNSTLYAQMGLNTSQ